MPAKKNDISERKKSDRRKKYKEALETLEDAMNFIKEKAKNYPEGKEGLLKVLDEFHYYVCEVCNYMHKHGEECPFIILEKEKSKDG